MRTGRKDWYSSLEPGIRKQVKLLRDNGFNTFSSCAHRMDVMIEGAYNVSLWELDNIHDLLIKNGCKEFVVYVRHELKDGRTDNTICVHFGPPKRTYLSLAWWVDRKFR